MILYLFLFIIIIGDNMLEYEISNDNKNLGKVKVFNKLDNIDTTLITDKKNYKYKLSNNNYQTYIITINVNNDDDLYDKVSIYKNDNIFEEIEQIKHYNNIKHIKNNTILDIIVPYSYLKNFNTNIDNIDLISLLSSKIYFIKNVLDSKPNTELKNNVNNIINDFNKLKHSSEYDFLTDEEKENKINKYIKEIDKVIDILEENTTYKYGENFITPIKIN